MTIKEAQDIIKKIPDYCEWDLKYNKAEEVVRKAIKDGYQLCKVDEVIEKTQYLAKNIHSDCANACAYEFGQILEEACK